MCFFQLDPSKNLVSQCVQGTGQVQINVEIQSHPDIAPRINIVDILKPADEIDETPGNKQGNPIIGFENDNQFYFFDKW